jgi:hypothetical protein
MHHIVLNARFEVSMMYVPPTTHHPYDFESLKMEQITVMVTEDMMVHVGINNIGYLKGLL